MSTFHPSIRTVRLLLALLALLLAAPALAFASPPDGAPRQRLAPAPAALDPAGWDDRFGVPGVYNGDVVAATVSAAGDLYVAGAFRSGDASVDANGVARWDGRRWHALGVGLSGGLGRARAIAAHGTDVYVVGSFTEAGGIAARQAARWDGERWLALGSGVGPRITSDSGTTDGELYAVAAAPDGGIYVAGHFNLIDATPANGVARWDGERWHALGNGIVDRGVLGGDEIFVAWVYALAVAPDGTLYAGGQFSDAGDGPARNVAMWDGAGWSALGAGVRGGDIFDGNQVRALAVEGERLYAGGAFTQAGDVAAANIAMWDGAGWSALGAGLTSDLSSPAPVLTLLAHGGTLYAGGAFSGAGGLALDGLARWDGERWSSAGPPLEATGFRVSVSALAPAPAGGIFAGGAFERAGGLSVNGVAELVAGGWESLGQGAALFGDISAIVNAVAVDGAGRIYIGGMINSVGGMPVNNIAMWDGERWHDLGGGVTPGPDGVVQALLVVGDDLYVGGAFAQAGGRSASRIARWDIAAASWSAVGAGFDDTVYALAHGDGVLYAGGAFDQADGATARDVAAWDGARWQALGGDWEVFEVLDSGNEAGTFVRALAYTGGELFIGGHFQTIHRKGASTQDESSYWAVHNVVGYAPGDRSWFALGPEGAAGVTTNGFSGISTTVYALASVNGGLYIGGSFNRGGGLLTPALARWDLRSGAWSSPGALASTGDVSVRALAGSGATLIVGGTFTSVGELPARSAALLDTAAGAWDSVGGGMGWRNGVARVNALALDPMGVYLGGEFSQAGPHPALGFARYAGDLIVEPPPPGAYRLYLPNLRR